MDKHQYYKVSSIDEVVKALTKKPVDVAKEEQEEWMKSIQKE